MEYIKTAVISVLIVVITLHLIVFQLLFFIQSTVIQPDFYLQLLRQQEFDGQLRQFLLKMATENLRFGHLGLPYLEEALSEPWIRTELSTLMEGVSGFLSGRYEELPIIPVYKIKERVTELLEEHQAAGNHQQLVQYWFDPLTDHVRFSYFISTEPFWQLRRFIMGVPHILLILSGLLLLFLLSLSGLTWSLRQGIFWFSTALTASSVIVMGLGILSNWWIGHSSVSLSLLEAVALLGFPRSSGEALFKAIGNGVAFRVNGIALCLLLVGGAAIHFIPIREDSRL